jgi:hypothetical protein
MHLLVQHAPNFLVDQALKMPPAWVQLQARLPQR